MKLFTDNISVGNAKADTYLHKLINFIVGLVLVTLLIFAGHSSISYLGGLFEDMGGNAVVEEIMPSSHIGNELPGLHQVAVAVDTSSDMPSANQEAADAPDTQPGETPEADVPEESTPWWDPRGWF